MSPQDVMRLMACLAISLSGCQQSPAPAPTESVIPATAIATPSESPKPTRTAEPTGASDPSQIEILGPAQMQGIVSRTYDDPGMQDFLKSQFAVYTIDHCVDQDVTGEGVLDRICKPTIGLEAPYYEINVDVDSDGDEELVVGIAAALFVLDRQADGFQRIGVVGIGPSRLTANLDIGFKDWTGDGQPEIVLDAITTGGGTNQFGKSVQRTLLTCRPNTCWPVWSDGVSHFWDDDTSGGFSRGVTQLTFMPATDSTPVQLAARSSGFSVECCTYGEGVAIDHPITVYTETETLYTLNTLGHYEPQAQRIIQPIRYPDFPAVTTVSDRSGNQAVLAWKTWGAHDTCLVQLNGEPVDRPFGCHHVLSTLEWRDVDADGQEDLLVWAYEPDQMDVQLDWDKTAQESAWDLQAAPCVGQHLRTYSIHQTPPRLLADVQGCVVDPFTLYGVRLEDMDGDGQDEITAALGGAENGLQSGTAVYRWDGQVFRLTDGP
ncbi:MAG: VCBS repeat-containing protein [Anaerolineales bacterium]|nr:VCBS repeat-containing protein [Anaerolineales bacterium]